MSAPSVRPTRQPPPHEAPVAPAPLPEDPELRWLRTVYRKGERQLTVRAVVTGMLLGGIMCLSNLYVVLKTGWSLGVTLTACILAFAIFRGLETTKVVKKEFTILENNAMGSVASAAGYMTGGGNMAAFPALLMLTAVRPDGISMFLWFAVIALLGVFAAIPVKRQLINREQLAFPTGTATAETLRSLHEAAHAKAGGGSEKARFLGIAAAIGAVLAWFRDAKGSFMPFNLPGTFELPFTIAGRAAKDWTLAIKSELVLFGAGALMSFRTGWSVLLGGLLTYVFLAPSLLSRGLIGEVSYKAIVAWTLWPGAALLVAAGLTSFALDWRSVARSLTGLASIFRRRSAEEKSRDPMAEVECPDAWFPLGFVLLGPIVVALMWILFDIPLWAGAIAVPLAVVMGFVAARVTGETDVTPTKALGPVTQLVYGVVTPGNLAGNLLSANVTGGIGLHAADLLTDLKSGYLLGANPRQQFYAQLFGCIAGAAVVVPAFLILVARSCDARRGGVARPLCPRLGRRLPGLHRRPRRALALLPARGAGGRTPRRGAGAGGAVRAAAPARLGPLRLGDRHRHGDPGQQRDRDVPRVGGGGGGAALEARAGGAGDRAGELRLHRRREPDGHRHRAAHRARRALLIGAPPPATPVRRAVRRRRSPRAAPAPAR